MPCPEEPTSPAIEENITNADRFMSRVSSCRFQAASTLARSTASIRSGVSEVIIASSSTPAAWITPDSGRCAEIPAMTPASAARSAASQAITCTRAPAASSSATSSAAPGASGPVRLSSARSRTPWPVTRWRANVEPAMPVPPVISTVPAESAPGTVMTTLPMWRAWLR
ncbi:hypothetical protein PICSAR240_04488 [Mycobacterium avium subsp. paratuberculosis]|nr:hypothetical protein PICSAR103_04503 [Mycobacterium avium subsp. paratuberculosis]CAG7024880.1 hypothetical protein PICSAR148_04502 [Mycobacterium avium subsp. paratuberculosis]CAG7208274.1 hypothetical protein PICSAR240_04488 [Mycobacterium avium subsp. paratuberculosis]CAG7305289.1 hypothetical protein PICSAR5_04465 [Mycobacterium avium subsp. paratuberculosis]CAG7404397.1 hypothetical protein PICSAR71_04476 [Mycobacterium avium subsp. paratuberculosis]